MRTSAELINSNPDKLTLSNRLAHCHNHTTEDAIIGWARDMADNSPDQWKTSLEQSPAVQREDTMIHGQRATWAKWLGNK